MKDNVKKIICGSLVALSIPVFVACGGKPTLTKPTELSIDQSTHLITWKAVENAEYYIVDINGQTYQTTTESFPAGDIIATGGKFYIKVTAVDRDDRFLQSPYSDVVNIENLLAFAKPDLSVYNNILSWTDVGAEYYIVSINNVKFEVSSTSLNLAELSADMLSAIEYGKANNFSVYAKATSNNLKSEVSNVLQVYVASAQQSPQNLNIQNQNGSIILTFDEVATATGYTVKVNQTEFTTNATTVDITNYITNGYGEYSVSVKANKVEQTDGQETVLLYMDSAYSETQYEHKPQWVTQKVTNLVITDGVLTFDEIPNVAEYIVFVDGAEYQTTTNSYNLTSLSLSAGRHNVTVCAKNGNYTSLLSDSVEYKVTAVLNSPGVSITEQDSIVTLFISPIQNAVQYQVRINQIIFNIGLTQVNITSYLNEGLNEIGVTALGDNDIYINSTESILDYTVLGMPQNLSINNGILTFNSVANCEGYQVFINSNLCLETNSTSIDISTYIQNVGSYLIQVRATQDGRYGLFASVNHYVTQKLDAPQNLHISQYNNSYILTFTHDVSNVVCYDIYINGALACQSVSNTVDITTYLKLGNNTVFVIAVGDGTLYLNSVASSTKNITVTKTLDKVKNIQVVANQGKYYLTFDFVEDADSYAVTIVNTANQQTVYTTSLTSSNQAKIDISSAIITSSNFDIKIEALTTQTGVNGSIAILNQDIKSYNIAEYTSKTYFYNGKDYTYCINTEEELKKFIFYAVLYRLNSAEVYINFEYTDKANAYTSAESLIQSYLPSLAKYNVDISNPNVLEQLFKIENLAKLPEILGFIEEVHDQIYLYYDVTSSLTSQKSNCVYTLNFTYQGDYEATETTSNVQKQTNTTNKTFAIDSLPTAPVETVAQLLMVVQSGRKPEFITTDKTEHLLVGGKSIAERTYLMARYILSQIINDSMTDYQKALAIHDWIVATNEYDNGTCDSAEGAPFSSDNLSKMSFYASGMLLKDFSVCKGYAQAFSLMCNIVGIKTVETFGITGSGIDWANVDFTTPAEEIATAMMMPQYATPRALALINLLNKINNIGAHSWNRIYIDCGEGEQWYIVDATWERQFANTKLVSHDYFMVNDNTISTNRKEFYPNGQFYHEVDNNGQVINFSANGSYNYYNDTNICTSIVNQNDLNNIVVQMIANGEAHCELIFDGSIVNNYSSMISQALENCATSLNDYGTYKKGNYIAIYKK